MSAIKDALVADLERHGITKHRVEMGGKHPRLCFQVGGRERFYVFPGTMFDGPARHTVIGDLRKVLREVGCAVPKPEKPAAPKKRKHRRPAKPPPARVEALDWTRSKDPFAALSAVPVGPNAALLARIDQRADEACWRLSFFKGSYKRWVAAGRPAK